MTVARLSSFSRAGLRFDVTDAGPLEGPVTVLLHGFPATRSSWDGVIPLLTSEGRRVVTFDGRGYSPGARPSGRAAYRPRELVRDVVALLDALGEHRVSVVGHDWGGLVAWWLGRVIPSRIEHLTVLSTPHPRALSRSILSSGQGLRSSYIALFQLPVLPELLLRPRLERLLRSSGLPVESAREYAERMAEPGALTAALDWYRGLALPGGGRPGGPPRITVPTTYLWGNRDFALGRRAAELTARYVTAPYRFVEIDAGHWLPETRAADVADAILRRS